MFTAIVYGQSAQVTISGKVTNEKTGAPIPFANVYINNSSIGTTTNENGAYTLANLPLGNLELAVSSLGFNPIKEIVRFEQPGLKTVHFKMREGIELDGVIIYSRKSKLLQQRIKIITRELLGQSKFSKQCKLRNPEVLRITAPDNGHLLAQTTSPLIIENYALGYIIHQDLDDFDYHEGKVYYGGNTRFELMKPENEAQQKLWRANQKIAYKGSLKQLLSSMVSDSLQENGFRVFQEIPESRRVFNTVRVYNGLNPLKNHLNNRLEEVRGITLIQPGELETERLVVTQTQLEVFNMNKRGRSPYTDMAYSYSTIKMPNGYIVITPQGWVVTPMGFEIRGDLGNDRFANLLPSDWKRD
ncbi:carboxypeptidase-like regulatory domain-containing protein [Arundinibacter roseus]|uniref:carboxypeptidase-like regulatory domain-containing protein n=1 Tax=Arundinibacter roseus TaxID=2070510 RepID=UPI001E39B1CE|nr:carboxypeptidase-like regulatory domain-containing protein [Arundinibacter roseus]